MMEQSRLHTCAGQEWWPYKKGDEARWQALSIPPCTIRLCAKMDKHKEIHGSTVASFEDTDCVEVYLYRRNPTSYRSTARLFVKQSLAIGRVDLDFPLQHLALRVGDRYYEATRRGPSLEYRQYRHENRAEHDWLPDSNHSKVLLGCTDLSHEEIHERGEYRHSPRQRFRH